MAAEQLVGFEIHGFHTLEDLDIGNIVKDAGRRWLSGHEIYAIICNHKHFCVYTCPVNLPKSGAILLFDRKRLRNFRKDGHNWKKKKDGKTVKESHECLKVGNEERIHAYYVHGQDNPNFTRRCYWLLDKNPERDIVLVHYRDVEEESGAIHVYYAGNKDFLESTGLGDNLTAQNHEWRPREINPMELDELPPTNDSNNSTSAKEDEVSSFDQSNQIERKRQREDVKAQPEGSGSEDKRRRFPTCGNVVLEVMKMQSVQKFPEPILGPLMQLVQNFPEPILGPLIRRMVKEEVKRELLEIMKQNCGNEATTSGSRSVQVNFIDNLSPPVFSGAGIEGEDCCNLREDLVDAHIDQQPLSYDGEALAIVHYPASLPCTESPNGHKFLASGEVGEFDYTQQCAPAPDIFSVLNEHGLDNLDNMDLRYGHALPCTESPNGPKFLASGEIGKFDYTQQCAPSPDIFSVMNGHGLDNCHNLDNMDLRYDHSLPCTESPNGPKFLASGEIGEFDCAQQCAPSPDIFSVLNEHGLDNLDNMGLRYGQASSLTCSGHCCAQFFNTYFGNHEFKSYRKSYSLLFSYFVFLDCSACLSSCD